MLMFIYQDHYDGYMMDICHIFRILWNLCFGTMEIVTYNFEVGGVLRLWWYIYVYIQIYPEDGIAVYA